MTFQPRQSNPNVIPQRREALIESYNRRLKEDVRSMMINFEEIIRLGHTQEVNSEYKLEQDTYEMQVRAGNMVRAAESLLKLVSDIKDYLIIYDMKAINVDINKMHVTSVHLVNRTDDELQTIRDEAVLHLHEIEEEYCMSPYKN